MKHLEIDQTVLNSYLETLHGTYGAILDDLSERLDANEYSETELRAQLERLQERYAEMSTFLFNQTGQALWLEEDEEAAARAAAEAEQQARKCALPKEPEVPEEVSRQLQELRRRVEATEQELEDAMIRGVAAIAALFALLVLTLLAQVCCCCYARGACSRGHDKRPSPPAAPGTPVSNGARRVARGVSASGKGVEAVPTNGRHHGDVFGTAASTAVVPAMASA